MDSNGKPGDKDKEFVDFVIIFIAKGVSVILSKLAQLYPAA